MGRQSYKSPFELQKLPTEEEMRAFSEDDGPCCTADNFRPDLNGTARSPWNCSIADVFVEEYMADGLVPCDDPALVKKYFVRHLRYLITKFKEQHTNADVLAARMKLKRRRERRGYLQQLFQRRLIAAHSEPGLHRHVHILQRLGPEGMSSDESAMENGVKQFRILKKEWRNERLTGWLRVFDAISRERRANPVTETTRGAEPRQRFQSGKVDSSTPPVGALPSNAYDPTWYANLTPYRRQRLQARKNAYDFTHTPDIMM
ncbi:hypothetical protein C8Q76DRAFT_771240 [Earliella scabrosa]|nr:hypothetical protein C8Q76DRAFT_771240 [Earliella scabrosa]